eukprot:72859-Chlamydomonas_euryale.AAC.3
MLAGACMPRACMPRYSRNVSRGDSKACGTVSAVSTLVAPVWLKRWHANSRTRVACNARGNLPQPNSTAGACSSPRHRAHTPHPLRLFSPRALRPSRAADASNTTHFTDSARPFDPLGKTLAFAFSTLRRRCAPLGTRTTASGPRPSPAVMSLMASAAQLCASKRAAGGMHAEGAVQAGLRHLMETLPPP